MFEHDFFVVIVLSALRPKLDAFRQSYQLVNLQPQHTGKIAQQFGSRPMFSCFYAGNIGGAGVHPEGELVLAPSLLLP